jgi:bacillolysin
MKKNYTLIAILLSLFTSSFVFAQKNVEIKDKFIKATNAKITTENNSERVQFIKFPVNKSLEVRGSSLKQKSMNFLVENKAIYGLKSIENSLIFNKEESDSHGLKNVSFKQYHNGVPVFDGELRFHYNATGKLNSVNGNVFPLIKLNVTPNLSEAEASKIALRTVESQNISRSEEQLLIKKSELLVFKKGLVQRISGAFYLVYRVEVSNELDVREYLFIDAHDGSLVEQFTGIAHALDRIVYEVDNSSSGNIRWKEGDSFPGFLDITQQAVVVSSGHVYNFFNNAFGFNSYDNADAQMVTIVNGPNVTSTNGACNNATWNGSYASFCDGGASDDITGHEWGHAYMDYTANLIYAYQSGALNEAYSDIWGETIDLINNYGDADGEDNSLRTDGACDFSAMRWKMGENTTFFNGAIRDMWDPTCFGNPGKSSDDAEYNCSTSDNGGVHGNSGIPNHAYALLVDGGTYNGQTISGLGFTKAAHIFWRVQSVYLTPTSDFISFADALEASASDLLGTNLKGLSTDAAATGLSGEIITVSDVEQVAKAILAVELRGYPEQTACGYAAIAYPAAVPALCDASTTNPLFSEDWESGLRSWTVTQLPSNQFDWIPRDWAIEGALPDARSGTGIFAANSNYGGDCITVIQDGLIRLESPLITMPDIATGDFHMSFNHYVYTEADYDGGNIKYSTDDGTTWTVIPSGSFTTNSYNRALTTSIDGNTNPMAGEVAFSGISNGWGQSTVDLTSLGVVANSGLKLRFELGTDGCNGSNFGWYLDEIVIYNCSALLAVSKYDLLLQDISVYPNPTSDTFTIRKLASLNLLKAEVFDINGRKLKEADLSEMVISRDIDINELATGIYFVTVTSEDAKATVKLIKQ